MVFHTHILNLRATFFSTSGITAAQTVTTKELHHLLIDIDAINSYRISFACPKNVTL